MTRFRFLPLPLRLISRILDLIRSSAFCPYFEFGDAVVCHTIAEKDSLPGTINCTLVLIDREFESCFKELCLVQLGQRFSPSGSVEDLHLQVTNQPP